jgi:hypothetical protein
MLCFIVHSGVQHILCCVYLCMVVSNTYYVVFTCVWWCPTHIMLCFLVYGPTHILLCFCFVFLCFMYAMLPVSQDCSFLIAPLVFYSVYLIQEINAFTNHSVKMVQTCVYLNERMVSYKKQGLFILREDLCSLGVFLSGICVVPIFSFLCCVFCLVCLRFVSYIACVSALSLLIIKILS